MGWWVMPDPETNPTSSNRIAGWVWDSRWMTAPAALNLLENFDMRLVIGPPVRDRGYWPRVSRVYADFSVRVGEQVAVRVDDCAAVSEIPMGYPICPELDSRRFDPWLLKGRRVWLRGTGAGQRRLWERYCELKVVGVAVDAVFLDDLQVCVAREVVCGGDLRYYMVSGWWEEDRLSYSLRRLRDFWAAAGALYG